MSLIDLVIQFVLSLVFIFIVVGVTLHIKNRNTQKKPSLLAISALSLQLLLFAFFFTGILASFNETFIDILLFGAILCGVVIGIREFKNNISVSLLNILLSILLVILMFLMLLIGSM